MQTWNAEELHMQSTQELASALPEISEAPEQAHRDPIRVSMLRIKWLKIASIRESTRTSSRTEKSDVPSGPKPRGRANVGMAFSTLRIHRELRNGRSHISPRLLAKLGAATFA